MVLHLNFLIILQITADCSILGAAKEKRLYWSIGGPATLGKLCCDVMAGCKVIQRYTIEQDGGKLYMYTHIFVIFPA